MKLQIERESRGWSRAELARRARLNPSTVSLIEAGRLRPYPSQLEKLCGALGLPASDAEQLCETLNERSRDRRRSPDRFEPRLDVACARRDTSAARR
jgi:transcriptional regulator with XRE-family HTH domain